MTNTESNNTAPRFRMPMRPTTQQTRIVYDRIRTILLASDVDSFRNWLCLGLKQALITTPNPTLEEFWRDSERAMYLVNLMEDLRDGRLGDEE